MYFNNLLILLALLIGGCAQIPVKSDLQTGTVTNPDSNIDLNVYRDAITYLNAGQLDDAELLFYKIIKQQPDLAGPWANLGLINLKRGQLEKGEKNIRTALKKDPKLAQAYNLLGYIENRKGNILKAIENYEKAIEYKPDYSLAYYNIALLYDTYLQDIPKAIMYYEKYLSILNSKDEKTVEWVNELKSSLNRDQT